ncbi:MAG: tRNA pseudouridine(13) synthase TruD [Planctomycetota bacterium]
MKVKQRPEDFRVEEVTRLVPGAEGIHTLYRLEKSGIDTRQALRVVERDWSLRRGDVQSAGLKDRYGVTGQVVSIRKGPARNFRSRGLKLNYLGRSPRPASRGTIERNRFRIVLRHLLPGECDRVGARARAAACHGFPDYFDDQRFGSVRGTAGEFIARALLRGETELALRLAIASPARKDRSQVKRRRRLLRERWGEWSELAKALEPSVERRICERLEKGAGFDEAYAEIDPALRSLHLAAYQAHVFNECLRRSIGEGGPSHPGLAGPYLFYRGDPGEVAELRLPLASGDAEPRALLDTVLAEAGIDRENLGRLPFRAGGVRGRDRRAEPGPDEADPGLRAPIGLLRDHAGEALYLRYVAVSYPLSAVSRMESRPGRTAGSPPAADPRMRTLRADS